MSIDRLRRNYIAFEGIIRCGKSTQFLQFTDRLINENYDVFRTREPGGSQIAEHLRETVQGSIFSNFREDMTPECEVALYGASRAQVVPKYVIPSLKAGKIVVSDRSALTSIAYQGEGRGLGRNRVFKINDLLLNGFWPGFALFIDTDVEVAVERAKNVLEDKFEAFGVDFFFRARNAYLDMSRFMNGITHVETIDGNGSIEEVHDKVWSVAIGYLGI